MFTFGAILTVIILWSFIGYMTSRSEQIEYTVIKSLSDYEIRLCPAHIVAQTVVQGPYQQALSEGFRIVASYIFGGNTTKERIPMTSPVTEQKSNKSIAMTAPVIATIEGDAHTIAFGMPRSYTLETLPTPIDPRVVIVTIPERKLAVIRFSWLRSHKRVQLKTSVLLGALKRDKIEVRGEPQYAGYNPPWTPPWMTRNEVLVEII